MKLLIYLTTATLMASMTIWAQQNPQQTQPQQTPGQQPAVQQQPQAAPPPCEAAKKPGRFDRMKQHMKARAEQIAQQEENKGTVKLGKRTDGNVDGTDVPSVTEVVGPKQLKPCTPVPPANTKQ